MINKLCLIFTIGFAGVSYAQPISTSPFSTQGIGESGGLEDSQFGAYGNCRAAIFDSSTVNLFNPASYTALAKDQPLFTIGLSSRFSKYTLGDATTNSRFAGLNQITMVLPLGKRFGMAIGLQPFSRKGYSIEEREFDGTDSIRYTYNGSGSTQEVLGGLAYKFLNTKRHMLSLGVNYSYVFGSVTDERQSSFIDYEPTGGVDQTTYRLHAFHYSVGLNYSVMLDTLKNQYLKIGAVYSPQQKLSAHRDYFLFATTDLGNPNIYDTLIYTVDDKGELVYPSSMTFGFNYSFRPRATETYKHKNVYQLNVMGDFSSTMWSNYRADFNTVHEENAFKDAIRFSLGLQFVPNYSIGSKVTGGSDYFGRVRYRLGGYYGTLPNLQNGTQLNEMGVTVGLGLPIFSQKTNSSFNFSFQYGTRGNGLPDGIQENYLGVNFGVILAPANYDRWFKKYKLD
ncbi:MAG: hypothetical protein QE487_18035 [Fluviicola sp.]|nr:hypothetical protein [Fluviicola sp.]